MAELVVAMRKSSGRGPTSPGSLASPRSRRQGSPTPAADNVHSPDLVNCCKPVPGAKPALSCCLVARLRACQLHAWCVATCHTAVSKGAGGIQRAWCKYAQIKRKSVLDCAGSLVAVFLIRTCLRISHLYRITHLVQVRHCTKLYGTEKAQLAVKRHIEAASRLPHF